MLDTLTYGDNLMYLWLGLFLAAMLAAGIVSGFFKARKIQPKGFSWKIFRNEIVYSVINVVISGFLLGPLTTILTKAGWITFNTEPAAWWVIALEFAAYFIGFDTWFYWLHRWMHKEPYYSLIHKLHHKSTSPNLMTTFSVNPLESLINGGFVPLFAAAVTVHAETMALIAPTNVLMGLYVHSGYEFLPRWWNKTWLSKWFISATFHDQHHKYFNWNFGGYTTIWDRICGTVRKNFERDFENPKARQPVKQVAEVATPVSADPA